MIFLLHVSVEMYIVFLNPEEAAQSHG